MLFECLVFALLKTNAPNFFLYYPVCVSPKRVLNKNFEVCEIKNVSFHTYDLVSENIDTKRSNYWSVVESRPKFLLHKCSIISVLFDSNKNCKKKFFERFCRIYILYMYVYLYISLYIFIYIYTYTYIYIYIKYMYIYIHTLNRFKTIFTAIYFNPYK